MFIQLKMMRHPKRLQRKMISDEEYVLISSLTGTMQKRLMRRRMKLLELHR